MGDYRETREARNRRLLNAASDCVHAGIRAGKDPAAIIADLVAEHGAMFRPNWNNTNLLLCCGVRASCTWSRDAGLLKAWRRNSTMRLMSLEL